MLPPGQGSLKQPLTLPHIAFEGGIENRIITNPVVNSGLLTANVWKKIKRTTRKLSGSARQSFAFAKVVVAYLVR
jgi:hypothetical protein